MTLTIGVRQTGPGVVTLTLQGPLDGSTHESLDQELDRVMNEPVRVLVLDIEGVDFVTSAGIGTIMKAKTSLAQKRADLVLLHVRPQIEKVFEILRALPGLGILPDRAELDEYLGRIQSQTTVEDDC